MCDPRDSVEGISGVRIGRHPLAIAGHSFDVVEPATGYVLATVLGGGPAEATLAVDSAYSALGKWGEESIDARASALRNIAEILTEASAGPIAKTLTRETGKRLEESQAEIRFSARYFEWFADVLASSYEQSWSHVPGVSHRVLQRPLGVVAVLTPWNFPVSIPARKIAPALAMGCTIVFRPSQHTPQASMWFAEIVEQCVPSGVINTVTGDAAAISETWLDDDRVAGITFTGSTEVGRMLAEKAGKRLKRSTLELGGRAPFVVCEDADVAQAVDHLMVAKYRNNGESCIAANNVWVHESLWGDVVEEFLDRSQRMEVGNPATDDVDLGPVRTQRARDRLGRLLDQAAQNGAEVVGVKDRSSDEGFFISPTVCLEPDPSQEIWTEEIFGPVTPMRPFVDLETVIRDSQESSYGLAAYVAIGDEARGFDLARQLDAGIVGVNVPTPNTPQVPFGGLKDSGFGGYEGGSVGLDPFFEYQSIALGAQ